MDDQPFCYIPFSRDIPDPGDIQLKPEEEANRPKIFLEWIAKYLGAKGATLFAISSHNKDLFPAYSYGHDAKSTMSRSEWQAIHQTSDSNRSFAFIHQDARFVSTFEMSGAFLPMALQFDFEHVKSINNIRCIAVSVEFWALLRSTELSRRSKCIAQINDAQRLLPDEDRTLHEVCRALMHYFGADIVSVSLIQEHRKDLIIFKRFYITENTPDVEIFKTNKGFSQECVSRKAPLIVSKIDKVNHEGEVLVFTPEDIQHCPPERHLVPFIRTPKTERDEESLMFVPLFNLAKDQIIGVAKVGDFNKHSMYDEIKLSAFASIGDSISLLLNVMQMSQAARNVGIQIESAHQFQNLMGNILAYKEISLGLFHQVSHKLHDVYLLLEELVYDLQIEQSISSERFLNFSQDAFKAIKVSKSHIIKAQKLGSSKAQNLKKQLLVQSVLQTVLHRTLEFADSSNDKQKVKIEKTLGKLDFLVEMDADYMVEAFINIVSNSIWAVRSNHKLSEKRIKFHIDTDKINKIVYVVIEDNGIGIEAENIPRIFEPLFTSKGDKGTGYGLFFTKRIIEESDGTISVDRSIVGRGTKIRVCLPYLKTSTRSN